MSVCIFFVSLVNETSNLLFGLLASAPRSIIITEADVNKTGGMDVSDMPVRLLGSVKPFHRNLSESDLK